MNLTGKANQAAQAIQTASQVFQAQPKHDFSSSLSKVQATEATNGTESRENDMTASYF